MKPALTTSGKTRTATAFDLHLAAAGFCATSCCKARRESLTKFADAVPVVSKVIPASTRPGRMCFISLIVYNRLVDVDPIFVVPTAARLIGLWGYNSSALNDLEKNRPPDERRPTDLTNPRNSRLRLEVEPHTSAE